MIDKPFMFLRGRPLTSSWGKELLPRLLTNGIHYKSDAEGTYTKEPICTAEVFVITAETYDIYTIAEVVLAATRRQENCILYIDYDGFSDVHRKALMAIEALIKENKATVVSKLLDIIMAFVDLWSTEYIEQLTPHKLRGY